MTPAHLKVQIITVDCVSKYVLLSCSSQNLDASTSLTLLLKYAVEEANLWAIFPSLIRSGREQ